MNVAIITATNDPKPWMMYINHTGGMNNNESIVLCGHVNKPNPVGKQMLCELILTSTKRLIYVDSRTLEEKGALNWKSVAGLESYAKIVS